MKKGLKHGQINLLLLPEGNMVTPIIPVLEALCVCVSLVGSSNCRQHSVGVKCRLSFQPHNL